MELCLICTCQEHHLCVNSNSEYYMSMAAVSLGPRKPRLFSVLFTVDPWHPEQGLACSGCSGCMAGGWHVAGAQDAYGGRQAAMQRFSCACLGLHDGAAPHDHPANLRQEISSPGPPRPLRATVTKGHTVSTDGAEAAGVRSHRRGDQGGVPDGGG